MPPGCRVLEYVEEIKSECGERKSIERKTQRKQDEWIQNKGERMNKREKERERENERDRTRERTRERERRREDE
ncbi:unnamed protein product [Closterium sp. NIES-53]